MRQFKLIFGLLSALLGSSVQAADDGYFLVQWGPWNFEEVKPAIEKAWATGAGSISLMVNVCQKDQQATEIHFCWSDPGEPFEGSFQEKRLKETIGFIHELGMKTVVVPFVHSPTLAQKRHKIKPSHFGKWFLSYGDRMLEIGRFAEELKVSEFVLGSELSKLFKDEQGWRSVISRVRKVYSGHVTVGPILHQYPFIRFWDALDSIGVSAYFPLSLFGWNTKVGSLTRAWKFHRWHLKLLAKKHKKPITFVEIGYPSTNVAARIPWDFKWDKRRPDPQQQARCYEAFYNVWKDEEILRSFRIWSIGTQNFQKEKGFSPFDKPAEQWVSKSLLARKKIGVGVK